MENSSLVFRLRKRAEIRRSIPHRKSNIEGRPDRIAELLDEAANYIEQLEGQLLKLGEQEKEKGLSTKKG